VDLERLADLEIDKTPQVREQPSLPAGEGWVVCCTIMGPVGISVPLTQKVTLGDKPQVIETLISPETAPIAKVFQPPNGIVTYRFVEADERRAVHNMFLGVKRVRNCLAFLVGVPIPVRYAFASKTTLWRGTYPIDDPMRYHPEVRPDSGIDPDQWNAWVRAAFSKAEDVLRRIHPMEPLGRAISLAGDAVWNMDPEEAFLFAWKAVDVIARLDYKAARALGPTAVAAYAALTRPAPGHEGCKPDVSVSTMIRVSLAKRLPDLGDARIVELNRLRGTVAHDTLDVHQFGDVIQARWEAIHIARSIVRGTIDATLSETPAAEL